jgi:hypothetical protein
MSYTSKYFRIDEYKCNEAWEDIAGFEGKYQVSSFGRVKSLTRNLYRGGGRRYQPIKEIILKQYTDSAGYPYLSLNIKNNKSKRVRTHRLVAKAFLKNTNNKPCVNHKDGNKGNNHFKNLEWCTYGENKSHSFKVLGEKHWLKNKLGKDCPYSKKIEMFDLQTKKTIKTFYGMNEASRETGAGRGNIWSVCKGTRLHALGFGWRYSDVV